MVQSTLVETSLMNKSRNMFDKIEFSTVIKILFKNNVDVGLYHNTFGTCGGRDYTVYPWSKSHQSRVTLVSVFQAY